MCFGLDAISGEAGWGGLRGQGPSPNQNVTGSHRLASASTGARGEKRLCPWLCFVQERKSATEVKMHFIGVNCAPVSAEEELGGQKVGWGEDSPPLHILWC